MPKQIAISDRTVFVDVNAVRAARGCSTDKVNELVDSELIWVFDLAQGKREKFLRFWLAEILDSHATARLTFDEVMTKILPASRKTVNGSEIAQWFLVTRTTVQKIGRELGGVVKKGLLHVERDRLATWLRRRWIGSSP